MCVQYRDRRRQSGSSSSCYDPNTPPQTDDPCNPQTLRSFLFGCVFKCGTRSTQRTLRAARRSCWAVGAWGCGVFRNLLPSLVADLWSEVLDTLEWRAAASPMWCSRCRWPFACAVSSRSRPARPLIHSHSLDGRTGARFMYGCTGSAAPAGP